MSILDRFFPKRNSIKQDEEHSLVAISKYDKPMTDVEKKYFELIWAVGKTYPDETRHETALRYIKEVESFHGEGCKQA